MSDSSNITFSDIRRKYSDFSFTGKLADYAKNDSWVKAYENVVDGNHEADGKTTMWYSVSSGSEDVGDRIFSSIYNYIDTIGNVDTCDIDHLKKFADIVGVDGSILGRYDKFPIEIKGIVDILSVNRAYLYNKSVDGDDSDSTIIRKIIRNSSSSEIIDAIDNDELFEELLSKNLSKDEIFKINTTTDCRNELIERLKSCIYGKNTILHYLTVEKLGDSLSDVKKLRDVVHKCLYNTISEFINLKNVTFDDSKRGIEPVEIWKKDTKRFTDELWNDDIETDSSINELKNKLHISKRFTEKIYADDIISGTRELSDFSESEQTLIKAEIENRKTRYSDANSMKYYYIRMYKVLEYFRFCSTVYNSIYTIENYDLDDNKYVLKSSYDNNVLVFRNNEFSVNDELLNKVSENITDYIFDVSKMRTYIRSQCQRNTITGTKRLIIDSIRKYIIDSIGHDSWNTSKNSILKNSCLNENFDVDIIQYVDTTDYANIECENDSVVPSEHTLRPRYWENYNELNNAIDNDEIRKFFNRISDDGMKFSENCRKSSGIDEANLYDFLSILFETGATENTVSDYVLSSDSYSAEDGLSIRKVDTYHTDDKTKKIIEKYSGDAKIGIAPYANEKNTLHPSFQLFPFIQAFEEYNEVFSGITNVVVSYTENMSESVSKLKERIDDIGNTINFWHYWNDDFSGYSTTAEKSSSESGRNSFIDSPFNMDALNDYLLYRDEFIKTVADGNNEYYMVGTSGEQLLSDEMRIVEVERLKRYYNKIRSVSGKEIYSYGKDLNGNIYILYKDEGNRNEKSALGDIWVRMKGHPLAFPLFDLNYENNSFNGCSLLSETNNAKLISILNSILYKFSKSYGKHNIVNKKENDGDIKPSNLSLSYGTYSSTMPIMAKSFSKSASSEPEFKYTYEDFNIEGNPKLKFASIDYDVIKSPILGLEKNSVYDVMDVDVLSGYSTTTYFVDSITNEIIGRDDDTTCKVYEESSGTEESNTTGRIIAPPDEKYFYAEYSSDKSTFSIVPSNPLSNPDLVFFDYDDDIVNENGKSYYCIDSSNSYGTRHPCMKRRITLHKVMKLDTRTLSGSVDEKGNVRFGGDIDYNNYESNTPYSTCDKFVTTESASSIVDGSSVYEDFDSYEYYATVNGETKKVDRSTIVFLGGSNPYHIYYDDFTNEMEIVSADYVGGALEEDRYVFGDNLYRDTVMSEYVSSFPVSDCVFKYSNADSSKQNNDGIDSFGQFSLRSNPYMFYYPYTKIYGIPFKTGSGSGGPVGRITIVDKYGKPVTFYYNLDTIGEEGGIAKHVRVKEMKYNRYSKTLNITSTKYNGEFELTTKDRCEYPIYLTFNSDGANNLATYSTYMRTMNQKKFFDMGFSYNQKLFYASYRDGDDSYLNGGTIIGRLCETYDGKYDKKLVLYREPKHNIEFFDSTTLKSSADDTEDTISHTFHVGDCSSKSGIISVFCKKYNPTNDGENERIDLNVNIVTDDDVIKNKYSIVLKYPLYQFDNGDIYSSKVSCTTDKMYVSFVTCAPSDEERLSNMIDKTSGGMSGSARFGNIREHCSDYTITIFSFDISDESNVKFNSSDTRYIMKCGSYGYFSQFSGFDGKNNVFMNEKLSSDSEFYFEPKFDELSSSSDSIEFLSRYTSKITDENSSEISEPIGRFVNFYGNGETSDSDEITGIAISECNEYAYLLNAGSEGGNGVRFENFDGKRIYDVSRGIGNGVMFVADGDDTDVRIAAFINGTDAKGYKDVNGFKFLKIPVHSSIEGYFNTDYVELEDSSDCVYAMCSDKKTIVKTTLRERDSGFIPTSGLVEFDFSSNGIVESYENLPDISKTSIGKIYEIRKGNDTYEDGSKFINKGGKEWKLCERRELSESDIKSEESVIGSKIHVDSYENSSYRSGESSFAIYNGKTITIVGAYKTKTIVIESNTVVSNGIEYKPVVFFSVAKNGDEVVENVPYMFRYSRTYSFNGVTTVEYSVSVIGQDGHISDVTYLGDDGKIHNHSVRLDYSDSIVGYANTYDNTVKMLYTSLGGIWKYTLGNDDLELSRTFENIQKTSGIEDYSSDVIVHESKEHLVISYYARNAEKGGILWTRKNIPDSVGEVSTVTDINGNLLKSVHIAKILSLGETVLAEDSDSGLIYISCDDGKTFVVLEESMNYKMSLVGCGSNRFYSEYANGEKCYSTDGFDWYNENGIPFSKWVIANACGIDYIACKTYDSDVSSDSVDVKRYVSIDAQLTLDEEYDGIVINGESIVCYGPMDGDGNVRITRSKSISSDFEYYEFKRSKGFSFNRGNRNGTDLVLPPDGGTTVVIVKNAFNFDAEPYLKFVDISTTTNNTVNAFGGIVSACGRPTMFPSVGDRILSFNGASETFYNLMSFGSTVYFSDMDSIDGNMDSEAVLTSKFIESDGNLSLYKTNFKNNNNYGIVEIDEGFPIMVTYGKYKTRFRYEGDDYDIYSITFTFMNDSNRRHVSILSVPELKDGEAQYARDIVNAESSKSAMYISGNNSACYNFKSIGNDGKYKITKIFNRSGITEDIGDFLNVTYSLQSATDRNSAFLNYELSNNTTGMASVYKNFDNPQFNIYLKNIDTEGKTQLKLFIEDSEIEKIGHVDVRITACFSPYSQNSDCTIYWGDGEMYEDVVQTFDGDEVENKIVKDGKPHVYKHSYYSSGLQYITIGDGLMRFECGSSSTKDDRTKTYVKNVINYSNSTYLTSVESAFKDCVNLEGPLPNWGSSITNARETYKGCTSLDAGTLPEWNDCMTDISDCYYGCILIGK